MIPDTADASAREVWETAPAAAPALPGAAENVRQEVRLAVLAMVGTTVFDGGLLERAMTRTLADQGVAEGSAQFERMLRYTREAAGMSKLAVFSHLFEDRSRAAAAYTFFERSCDELIADGIIRAVPGAEDAIGWLREAGVMVCLATGFGRHTQNMVLESLGWMGLADLSLCPADAGRGRPYPDMILTAVLALDLDDVRKVAVVGDSCADIESGLRAGATTVAGVLTGAHREPALRAAGATAVVQSVRDVPLILAPRSA
ncbi:HAD family hydrolase [Arthrobacter sp. NPDC058288]|uniref:HAD family hydrolase n=1 Tax=Arthrobacter sp. NPDC058288 TaxID=3346424 RepID=UPI0036E52298